MKRLKHTVFFMAVIALAACQPQQKEANYQIVPLPQEVVETKAPPFVINNSTQILYQPENEALKRNAEFLADYLRELTGKSLQTGSIDPESKNCIVLKVDETVPQTEGYKLTVNADQVTLTGKTAAGIFYGIQTLRKSLPLQANGFDIVLPAVEINDYPRFGYRGMHLDVARHFFPVEFVKRYIDILALHNINTFHWHLTDDQGWRIEIKKYPKLTEIGSMRKKTVIGKNTGKFDDTPYGGFFTQEEIKEVIQYAQDRYITIIPEIDLPGHMLAALAAYPEFGCTGGPYEVEPTWGVFEDIICAGNDDAMVFLQNVLDEVTDLFPSQYVHIGGDESPRDRWKVCPKCQARIKAEKLKADAKHSAEDRLQTWCMSRMEEFLHTKGRRIIGWDEILEGDVAPDATIMSWRGLKGGIEAAQLGHDVIMVPTTYLYFDYYQTDKTEDEPFSIGGFVSVEKTYSFEPVPAELNDDQKKHIIGLQANLWSEYILTPEHAEYMVLPRMGALAEVQWTNPEKKDYKQFALRLQRLMGLYKQLGYHYGEHILDIRTEYTPRPDKRAIEIKLNTIDDAPIYYTLDGTPPNEKSQRYNDALLIAENAQFRAMAIRESGKGRPVAEDISFNKATIRPITLALQPADQYRFNGAVALVDGLKGSDNFSTGRWIGFIGGNFEAVVDLEEVTEISRVTTQAVADLPSWIMGATGVTVSVSEDNQKFTEVGSKEYPAETDFTKKEVEVYEISFTPVKARYVKVVMKPSPALPKGHAGEGKGPFLFVDEIGVE